jgi:hypothetical protein
MEVKMRFVKTKTLALIISIVFVAAALPFNAVAAQPVTSVTVSSYDYDIGDFSGHVYTNPNQIRMLLSFIPPENERVAITSPAPTLGGNPGILSFVRNGIKEEWIFYRDSCKRTAPNAMVSWCKSSREVWDLLLRHGGKDLTELMFLSNPLNYKGERVTALYSLDGKNCSYHPVSNFEKYIPLLEKVSPDTGRKAAELGYLMVTEKGKYTWSFSDEGVPTASELSANGPDKRLEWIKARKATSDLPTLAVINNSLSDRHAQWLVYMGEDNIESISFGGAGGNGYSNGYHPSEVGLDIDVDTKNRESIHKIVSFLKSMEVPANARVLDGPSNPVTVYGAYQMGIEFKTGVTYFILGYGKGMSIHTSDLDKTVWYDVSESQTNALRDMMALLPEATLTTSTFDH